MAGLAATCGVYTRWRRALLQLVEWARACGVTVARSAPHAGLVSAQLLVQEFDRVLQFPWVGELMVLPGCGGGTQ